MTCRHISVLASVCIVVVFCAVGCGTQTSTEDGRVKVTVNGQTIDLKETATEVVRKEFQTQAAPRVRMDVFSGKITVEAGRDGKVEADVTKTAAGETPDEAKDHLKLIDVQMQQEGDVIRITARRTDEAKGDATGKDPVAIKKNFAARSADAVVRVPAAASLELTTAYGDVKVNGIAGSVETTTSSGSISLTGGTGELKLTSSYGKLAVDGRNTAVNATTKSGDVAIGGARGPLDVFSGYGAVTITGPEETVTARSNSGNVTVKAAKGPVRISSGYGTLTVDEAAAVEAETKSGDVIVRHATGAVQAKSGYGKLDVGEAPAGATLETSSGDIRLKAARGPVKLTSGYGSIDAEVAGAVVSAKSNSGDVRVRGRLSDAEHTLHSGYGKITLTLPADSQFRLDAHTNYGRVTSAFPVTASGKKDDKRLQGNVGDDPKVALKLTTSSGNIEVRKE